MISGKALWEWQKSAKIQAIDHSISPVEVDWLLAEFTDLEPLALKLASYQTRSSLPSKISLHELKGLWAKRLNQKIPIQYCLGKTYWRNFTLKVSPDVLIPRPETELIIDLAQKTTEAYPELAQGHWVDLGTGSGAIAIGLGAILPQGVIHGVDYSQRALSIAQENVQVLGTSNAGRIRFYQGSWWQPLDFLLGKVSGMVSNPPYIPSKELPKLQEEVYQYEPHLALDGGENGLEAIAHLVKTAPLYLHSGGVWLVEMMAGQGEAVTQLLEREGAYRGIEIFPDLSGIDRFVLAYRV